MSEISRRDLFFSFLRGAAFSPAVALVAPLQAETRCEPHIPNWAKGIEGQRKADLGDGSYLNPIVPGDHPDPSILKDGDDYYMTFSSFYSYPALVLWHSTDLVNWAPVGSALTTSLGVIWAVDLCKHGNRFFIYIPADPDGTGWSIYVIWADSITGPWSEPIDLKLHGCIDPGHAVGEDGKRYLFVNGIRRIALTDDGLATVGTLESAYDPWRYPDDWITENFAPEGPKLFWREGWIYLVTAVGGTAGPVTGHMVIAARSRSINGPWEQCPYNPLVRTRSESEPWWSRGHATVVEGPEGDWWMVYHGYENGFRTLGRQALLEPVAWTQDGWFQAIGGDLSRPLPKPTTARKCKAGFALSDDFSSNKFGIEWSFHDPGPEEMSRIEYLSSGLSLAARGTSPADSSPLTCGVVDRAYQTEVTLELFGKVEGGILLFYNHKAFVGLGFTGESLKIYQYAEEQAWAGIPLETRRIRFRITDNRHVITYEYSTDQGQTWTRHDTRMEVSGLNHNTFGGFLSLKIGIYSVGVGRVLLSDFRYRTIAESSAT